MELVSKTGSGIYSIRFNDGVMCLGYVSAGDFVNMKDGGSQYGSMYLSEAEYEISYGVLYLRGNLNTFEEVEWENGEVLYEEAEFKRLVERLYISEKNYTRVEYKRGRGWFRGKEECVGYHIRPKYYMRRGVRELHYTTSSFKIIN